MSPTGIGPDGQAPRFAAGKAEKTKVRSKNGKNRIKNAGIPTGIFVGLLKTLHF